MMYFSTALLGAILFVPFGAQHLSQASTLPSSPLLSTSDDVVAFVSKKSFLHEFISLQECQNFRFANSVLFATCASERTGVDLNECIGNEDGFLIYKTG
jgi:hypothetical protein